MYFWILFKFDFVIIISSWPWRCPLGLLTLVEYLTEEGLSFGGEAQSHLRVPEIRVVLPAVFKFVFTGAWHPLFVHDFLIDEVRVFLFGIGHCLRFYKVPHHCLRVIMWHAPFVFILRCV